MEIDPKDSTDFSSLTIAFCFASFCVSKDNTMVMMGFNPSGIAATAKAIANNKDSIIEFPWYT